MEQTGNIINIRCLHVGTEHTDWTFNLNLFPCLDRSGHGIDPEAWMFQPVKNGSPGTPLTRRQFHNLFARYARKAGTDVRAFPHMARATMITSAFEAGCTGEAIQRTVGHVSITTTEGYNHTAQKHRESASLKVGY